MKRLFEVLCSYWLTGTLFLFIGAVLGLATFIENDFGTNAARALIYNSWWFELAFVLLSINMLVNLVKHKMWTLKKLPVLVFHLAFLCIMLGAAITRYVGYEGIMHIREGEESNLVLSSNEYVMAEVSAKNYIEEDHQHVFFSVVSPGEYSEVFSTPKGKLKLRSTGFIPQAQSRLIAKEGGRPAIKIILSSADRRREVALFKGDQVDAGAYTLSFEPGEKNQDIVLKIIDGQPHFIAKDTLSMTQMQSGGIQKLEPGSVHKLVRGALYGLGDVRMVYTGFLKSAALEPMAVNVKKGSSLPGAIRFVAELNGLEKSFHVFGQKHEVGKACNIEIDGVKLAVTYGAKEIQIPFLLHLNRFELERYPGSDSPSSYASEVTLTDGRTGQKEAHRVYMNNILNYKGYRFFQSSYDRDEKGTVLSVNHDRWGTLFTYAGYFVLALGMAVSLFAPHTRFRFLSRRVGEIYKEKKKLLAAGLILFALPAWGQGLKPNIEISRESADAFAKLWVQDNGGRMKPVNSLNSEIVRKLVKHHTFKGLSADQVALGIMIDPEFWQDVQLITVKHDELRDVLKLTGRKSSIKNFFASGGQYKIRQLVEAAYRKNPAHRNKLEQEVVKVDEQVNVFYMQQMGSFYKLFPKPGDENNKWFSPGDNVSGVGSSDSLFIKNGLTMYLKALASGDKENEATYLDHIVSYQKKYGSSVLPSDYKKKIEVFYNKSSLFMSMMPYLMILGAILLLFQLIRLVRPKWQFRWLIRVLIAMIGLSFIAYTVGMVLRWYISGHAPWSDSYESLLLIGWALLLVGFVFLHLSDIVVSLTAIFASIVLMVAHLSWMNPEITNLVPVLKSYWLTIHVAIIVSSYGFLGLGFLLGFLNLILTGAKTRTNKKAFSLTIQELSAISEMSMTVGLYMLTIGAFLGGIWANESWGRYWGWDPKETWTAVTILVYAFVLHMRFIPGMKSIITFNLWSVISFACVIMTYLGVNYYLAGMHSYAKGDPVPVPQWVYYSLIVFAFVSFYAFYNEKKLANNKLKGES